MLKIVNGINVTGQCLIHGAVTVMQTASPPTPVAGQMQIYATGDRLHTKDSGGTVTRYSPAGLIIPYSISGPLEVGEGTLRLYNDTGQPWTIIAVRASVATAPAGSAVVIDVHKNGTSIFADPSGQPTIPASGTTHKVTSFADPVVADGDYLTVDIDAVGSSDPGEDLVVQITAV